MHPFCHSHPIIYNLSGGSNDEVEQTLNQLLACMDGLDSNKSGVIVIAATNRYEVGP